MVVMKLNQGKIEQKKRNPSKSIDIFGLGYIISLGINQKPEMLVGPTNKIGEYLKNCGY